MRAPLLSPVPQACHPARPACKPMCIVHIPPCVQVGQIKDAIQGGRGVRVTLWNMTAKREGFWNCLAIYPDHHNRYFLSVQAGPASI